MDLLSTGMAWLGGQLKAFAGREVVYARGSRSVTVTAIVGRTQFDTQDAPDFAGVARVESRDFLIDAADLDLGDGPELPRKGDTISETAGDKLMVYEVMPFGVIGDSHWEYADGYGRTKLRIHTKHVETLDL